VIVLSNVTRNFLEYNQRKYVAQMEEWLEFAWANKYNLDFKTPQTDRFRISKDHTWRSLGSRKGKLKTNCPTGGKMSRTINTHALYKAWREQSKAIQEEAQKRCFVRYDEAVPEMHIFFDYMDDMKSQLGYDGFEREFYIGDE